MVQATNVHPRVLVEALSVIHEAVLIFDVLNKSIELNFAAQEMFQLGESRVDASILKYLVPLSGKGNEDLLTTLEQNPWGRKLHCYLQAREGISRSEVFLTWQRIQVSEPELGEYIILVLSDISHVRQLEEELIQSQKVDMLGQLTSGVAHDFNNLVGVMRGALKALERSIAESDEVTPRIELLGKSLERATDLTRQLVSFVRKEEEQAEDFKLGDAIDEAVSLLSELLPKRISVENGMCEAVLVRGVQSQIVNILINLGINARDAISQKGVISFHLYEKEIRENLPTCSGVILPPERYGVIEVQDNGSGIPTTKIKEVFEPFYTSKESGAGTGLGLAIVVRIMRAHHGAVDLESVEGEGSKFRLFFPLSKS